MGRRLIQSSMRPRQSSRLWVVVLTACSLWAAASEMEATAQTPSGAMMVRKWDWDELPLRAADESGAVTRQGFRIDVEVCQLNGPGYVPVRISIQHPTPTTADRELKLVVVSDEDFAIPKSNAVIVEIPILVPEGTQSFSVERCFPGYVFGDSLRWKIFENGEAIPGLEGVTGLMLYWDRRYPMPITVGNAIEWQDGNHVLAITAAGRSLDFQSLPSASYGILARDEPGLEEVAFEYAQRASWRRNAPKMQQWYQQSLPNLSADWRAYRRFGMIHVEAETLDTMKEKWPRIFGAIRAWVLMGGQLVIEGSLRPEAQLREFSARGLDVRPVNPTNDSKSAKIASVGKVLLQLNDLKASRDRSSAQAVGKSIFEGFLDDQASTSSSNATTSGDEKSEGDPSSDAESRGSDFVAQLEAAEQAVIEIDQDFRRGVTPWVRRVGAGEIIGVPSIDEKNVYRYFFNPAWDFVLKRCTRPFASSM
ncbi:MAG: hypothetical protein AAF989_17185, partial [Planctomycetota bacterium]